MCCNFTCISRYSNESSKNFIPPQYGFGTDIWTNEDWKLSIFMGVSEMAIVLIHNIHNTVMAEKDESCKKICTVFLLDIASLMVIPLALAETAIRITLMLVVGLPMRLYSNWSLFMQFAATGVMAVSNIIQPIYTIYQCTFGTSNAEHFLGD